MRPDVFVYWEGPMPRWIDVCIESMARSFQGCHFNLVTPKNVGDFVRTKIPKNFYRLVHASQRSEYLRAALLLEHGGFYFDADTVGIRSPLSLAQLYSDSNLVYSMWARDPPRVISAYIYAIKGSSVIAEWLEDQMRLIDAYTPEVGIGWMDLSEVMLTPIILSGKHPKTDLVFLPTFMPIDIEADPSVLLCDKEPEEFIKPETICMGANHSWMMHYHPEVMNLKESEWKGSPHVILKLLSRYL